MEDGVDFLLLNYLGQAVAVTAIHLVKGSHIHTGAGTSYVRGDYIFRTIMFPEGYCKLRSDLPEGTGKQNPFHSYHL